MHDSDQRVNKALNSWTLAQMSVYRVSDKEFDGN